METKIFDGRVAAQAIKTELKLEAIKANLHPNLAVVLVGEDPASLTYVKQKKKSSAELGFGFELHSLPDPASLKTVTDQFSILNSQLSVDGLILQLPLPAALSPFTDVLLGAVEPTKDVDGLTPHSPFTPPTALAVLHVLDSAGVRTEGAQAVVLGRGRTSGAPVAKWLTKKGAVVSVIHSQTPLSIVQSQLSNADIIVSCVGQPNLIKGEMIKEGAAVIGVGLSKLPATNYQLPTICGDLDLPSLMGRAALVTPTPGGIGPLTVAFLLQNLLQAARKRSKT